MCSETCAIGQAFNPALNFLLLCDSANLEIIFEMFDFRQ